MRIDFETHLPSNCYSPVSPLRGFQFCSATKVYGSLKSITNHGYVRDKNNLRRTWRVRGVGTHSYFRKVRYTRGTPEVVSLLCENVGGLLQ